MRFVSVAGRYCLLIALIFTCHFFILKAMPGDPLVHILGEEGYFMASMNPAELERLRAQYGLDKSLLWQFFGFLKQAIQGNLGWSTSWHVPVTTMIKDRLPWTLALMFPAITISIILSGILGLWAGWNPNAPPPKVLSGLFLTLYSIPGYCLAMILVAVGGFYLEWFPSGGMLSHSHGESMSIASLIHHLILPVTALALHGTAYKFMVMKKAVLGILEQDYVLTAVSKGLSPNQVLWRHVFPNALPQLVNLAALSLGHMVSGALLVEIVFSWNGMGVLLYDAVIARDYPLLLGSFLLLTISVILGNALADMIQLALDPRIRDGAHEA